MAQFRCSIQLLYPQKWIKMVHVISGIPPGKQSQKTMERSTIFSLGKSIWFRLGKSIDLAGNAQETGPLSWQSDSLMVPVPYWFLRFLREQLQEPFGYFAKKGSTPFYNILYPSSILNPLDFYQSRLLGRPDNRMIIKPQITRDVRYRTRL